MNKRRKLIVVGFIIFTGSVLLSIYWVSRKEDPVRPVALPAEQVRVLEVKNRAIPVSIKITGRLIAEERIHIFSEVGGVFLPVSKPFKVGNSFDQGEILVHIDDEEFRQSLIASRSAFLRSITMLIPDIRLDYPESYDNWLRYINNFDVKKPIPQLPGPSSPKERYFLTGRNIHTQFHEIRQMEVRLGKYRIRAPFHGVVTEAFITTGSLVIQGQRLGEFIQPGIYELESTVSANDLRFVQKGTQVKLSSRLPEKNWMGTVVRIGEQIDPATQSLRIFIRVKADDLNEGMFLTGWIKAGTFENAEIIRREILIRERMVFVVKNGIARIRPVEVLHIADEEVVIRGLKDGDLIINERKTEAFEGTEVEPIIKTSR